MRSPLDSGPTAVTPPSDGAATSAPAESIDRTVARERVRGALFGTPAAVTIDRFTVIERVGEGGMSTVFSAYDPRLDRKIALKLLRDDHRGGTEASARQGRLLREARAMARLSHPNVGAVHDVGVLAGAATAPQVWIAMEFIDGEGLRQWCLRARPDAAEILDAYVQAGRGLAAAHAAGLVHRDFKPDNAMRDGGGRVRVLDFGLALTRVDDEPTLATTQVSDDMLPGMSAESLTRTGAIVGTPAFVAPEQIEGAPADARSDQFAFCVALHEALWGVRPFPGETIHALFEAVLAGRMVTPPRRADVPARVRAAILRGLDRDPARRWPDMDALLVVLAPRSPRRRAALFVGVGATALAAAIAFRNSGDCDDSDRATGDQWTVQTREQVRAAFVADGRAFTTELGTRVIDALDAYDVELRSAYHDACVATYEAGVQSTELLDRETACLDARGAGFRAVVELLVLSDPGVNERAIETVAGLASVPPCLDRAALLAITAPADPADAEPIGEIAARVAEASANRHAGRYLSAREHAEQAVAQAEALGHRPAHAEAAFELGLVLDELGEAERSCELLAAAHFFADSTGQDTLAANSASAVISCLPIGADRRAEQTLWRGNARAAIDRLPDPELAEADLDARYGFACYEADRYVEAIAMFEHALEVRRRRLPADATEIWSLELELASVLVHEARNDEAIAMANDAAARAERSIGADHPRMASVLSSVANVQLNAGDVVQSEHTGRRALAVSEAALGPEHRVSIAIVVNLASAVYMQERWDETAVLMRDGLDRLERNGRGDELDWARAAHNYATVLFELDRYDEALALADRSRAWYEAQLGDSDASAIDSYELIANIQLERKQLDEAERNYRLALDTAQGSGVSEREVELMHNLANFLRRADRPLESVQVYEEIIARMRDQGASPWDLAQADYQLARALWLTGATERAHALAEAALATVRSESRTAQGEGRFRRDASVTQIEDWLAQHVVPAHGAVASQ